MNKTGKYQYGRAEHPHDDDPILDYERAAIHNAQVHAVDDFVYAVWKWISEDEAQVICLVYGGDIYYK